MDKLQPLLNQLNTPRWEYEFGNFLFTPSYLHAGAIVVLIFLLILTIARIRYLYVHWSLGKSSIAMILWGFLLAVIVEGFLVVGGRTMFTELLGWENPPKPISSVLDAGRSKLVDVLGVTDEVPSSQASEGLTVEDINALIQNLAPSEKESLKKAICTP
jgi:hypothetical protein